MNPLARIIAEQIAPRVHAYGYIAQDVLGARPDPRAITPTQYRAIIIAKLHELCGQGVVKALPLDELTVLVTKHSRLNFATRRCELAAEALAEALRPEPLLKP